MWNACIGALILLQVTELQLRIERLDNSLRVIIVEDHTLPLLSVQLWYAVGSAYDDPRNPGLCHVTRTILEHRDDAALRLRAAGVRFESRTLPDACYFASLCPPNFLEYVLTIEAARMQPLKTSAETIAAGLATAARDYGLDPEDPAKRNERRLLAAMFPDHPYRNPPAFVAESLRTLAPDDVNEFLQRWFVPGNATLLIIGDVSDVAALDLVRQHFGKLPWAEPPRRPTWPTPPPDRINLAPVPAEHPGLDIAWLTPGAGFGESASTAVLMQRLRNPIDGPLARRLADLGCPPPRWHHDDWREQGMLVFSVDTDPVPSKDIGRFEEDADDAAPPRNEAPASAATSQPVDTAELERIIRDELERAARDIPTEVELNRARALAARELRLRRASFRQRTLDLGWNELVAGDVLLADFTFARTERLAVPDIQQAAADLLTARTVTEPRLARAPSRSQSGIPALPASQPARPTTLPCKFDPSALLALLIDFPSATTQPASISMPAPVTERLKNGVTLTTYAIPGLETAHVWTLFGSSDGDVNATAALMTVGSTRHTVAEIRDYLSYHGLDMFPACVPGIAGLESSGPASYVAQLVELQAELIHFPDCADAACEAAVRRTRAFVRGTQPLSRNDRGQVYLPPALIGWRAGMSLTPDPVDMRESLSHLTRLPSVQVVVIGDVTPAQALRDVELVWHNWRAVDAAESQPAHTPPSPPRPTTAPSSP